MIKTLVRWLYFLVTAGTLVIFFFFLQERVGQFEEGYYYVAPIDKQACEEQYGELFLVDGEERCYTGVDTYLTAEDLPGEDTPNVPKIDTFEECESAGGEVFEESGYTRCYISETEFWDKEEASPEVEPEKEKLVEEEVKIQSFEKCVEAGGEIYKEGEYEQCYMSETEFWDKQIPLAVIAEPIEESLPVETETEAVTITEERVQEPVRVSVRRPKPVVEVKPEVKDPTTFKECIDIKGELYEDIFVTRCYYTDDKYFEIQKSEAEIAKVIINFDTCKKEGGEVIAIPLNKRCYITDTLFFDEKTDQEVLEAINNFEDCKTIGGEVYENRCYLSETKYFDK